MLCKDKLQVCKYLPPSGEPSGTVQMRLRGVSSINSSSEPLFILDGSPISSGAFTALNPNDIESMTVLKDASSTAIYGSRAANGVVILTSKRGKKRRKGQNYDKCPIWCIENDWR